MENCLDLAIRTGGAAGSDAPTQTLIRLIRRTGRPADTLVYKSYTRVCVYILRKGCPPVRLVYPLPSIFFEFWRKDRHKKTSLKFRDSFGNDGTISVLKTVLSNDLVIILVPSLLQSGGYDRRHVRKRLRYDLIDVPGLRAHSSPLCLLPVLLADFQTYLSDCVDEKAL